MENKKIFSKYIMSFDGDLITSLNDSQGKDTLFSNTFYVSNKEYLDGFSNIESWVKPKKEIVKRNNIIINLDDFSIAYSNNQEKLKEEDLKLVMKIVKNELSEANPEIAKQKALLIKYTNDIKSLEDLQGDGFDFKDEIEEVKEKIEEVKEKINQLLEVQE